MEQHSKSQTDRALVIQGAAWTNPLFRNLPETLPESVADMKFVIERYLNLFLETEFVDVEQAVHF